MMSLPPFKSAEFHGKLAFCISWVLFLSPVAGQKGKLPNKGVWVTLGNKGKQVKYKSSLCPGMKRMQTADWPKGFCFISYLGEVVSFDHYSQRSFYLDSRDVCVAWSGLCYPREPCGHFYLWSCPAALCMYQEQCLETKFRKISLGPQMLTVDIHSISLSDSVTGITGSRPHSAAV